MKPNTSNYSADLSAIPYRDLNKAVGLDVYLTPENADSITSQPYPVRAEHPNRVVSPTYAGRFNYLGNVLKILPTASESAPIYSIDALHLELLFKYMYLAINNQDLNIAANRQFGKSINDALSKVHSESFFQLPFFTAALSSRYMPDTQTQGRGECLVWYQTMLQNVAIIISTYWNTLTHQKAMFQMGYNREYHMISSLMSYISKTSFRNSIKDLNTILANQFFDVPWYKQWNTIANGIARKSDDSRHPMLTITAALEVPDFKYVNASGITVFSSDDYRIEDENGNLIPFHQAVNKICSMLNPYELIKWARNAMNGTPGTPDWRTYGNKIQEWLDLISNAMAPFGKHTMDITAMLKVAQNGNLNQWTPGYVIGEPKFDKGKPVQEPIQYLKLVADIYQNYMASSYDLKWDETTLQWTFKTPWSATFGIPLYDIKNGGAFITFSNHGFQYNTGDTGYEQKYLVPCLYKIDTTSMKVEMVGINREGEEFEFRRMSRTITKDKYLQRLNLLTDASFDKIIMPVCNLERYSQMTTQKDTLRMAQILYLMEDLFGYGGITAYVPVTPGDYRDLDETSLHEEIVDADMIGFIDAQMEDVSNDLILFYQTYAPLKVYTMTGSRTIGFLTTDVPSTQA